jgi:hypothetical protein
MAQLAEKETKEHTERLNDQLEGVEQEVVIGEGNILESNLQPDRESGYNLIRVDVGICPAIATGVL